MLKLSDIRPLDRIKFLAQLMRYLSIERRVYAIEADLLKQLLLQVVVTSKVAQLLTREKSVNHSEHSPDYKTLAPDTMQFSVPGMRDGLTFKVPSGNPKLIVSVVQEVLYGNHYFHRGVRLEQGQCVIDGGAFVGMFSVLAATLFNAKKVFAFEPEPSNFKCLSINAKDFSNIETVNMGLFSMKKASELYLKDDVTGHSLCDKSGRSKRVLLTTIDLFVDEKRLNRVDFIKFDIEGAELDALEGAKETIFQFKPKLAISAYHRFSHIFEIPRVIKKLRPDYDVSIMRRNGQVMVYAE